MSTAYDLAQLDSKFGLGSGPAQTLLGYWPSDDASAGAGSTLHDASGGNIGAWPWDVTFFKSLAAPSIMPGDTSTCAHANGSGTALNYAGLSTAGKAAINQAGSIALIAWLQADVVTVSDVFGHQWLISQWEPVSGGPAWSLFLTGRGANFQITLNSGPTGVKAAVPEVIVPNNPVMLAGVYDGANVSLYINGILKAQTAASGALKTSTSNPEIGQVLGTQPYHGYLQKLALLGSAPSAAQIQNLYILGAKTTSEAAGGSINVFPFSRQVAAANPARRFIRLTNLSDSPVSLSLGDTTRPAVAGSGPVIWPNGGVWHSTIWKGAIQAIHGNWLGGKPLAVEEV